MPVTVNADLVALEQDVFARVAFDVMREVFSLHQQLGGLFDEGVYQRALALRIPSLLTEVRIDVRHADFRKSYFMDIVAGRGGVFELKTVDALNARHRVQLLNYLLLSGVCHGKLINFRPDRVEHEFVNATLTRADRTSFETDDTDFRETDGFGADKKTLVVDMLRDWGAGLERSLYEEALVHFFGGQEYSLRMTEVRLGATTTIRQPVLTCGTATGIRVTTLERGMSAFENHLHRFLSNTALTSIQWINIARRQVTFRTLVPSRLSTAHISAQRIAVGGGSVAVGKAGAETWGAERSGGTDEYAQNFSAPNFSAQRIAVGGGSVAVGKAGAETWGAERSGGADEYAQNFSAPNFSAQQQES
jgi:GxxExxY protein